MTLKLKQVLLQACFIWSNHATNWTLKPPLCPSDFVVSMTNPTANKVDLILFHYYICLKMIWKRILGLITAASQQALMTQKHHFQWSTPDGGIEFEGPTAVFLLMESVNPNTRVGFTNLKKKIKETSLPGHDNNIRTMLTSIQANYMEITDFGGLHDNNVKDMFAALLSSKNQAFRNFIQ